MLRHSALQLHYFGRNEIMEMSSMLSGRGRHEAKLGKRWMRRHLKITTQYRTFQKANFDRACARATVQAAVMELGTEYSRSKNDLGRMKTIYQDPMLTTIARLEPMSWRALLEFTSSGIAPPLQNESGELFEWNHNDGGGGGKTELEIGIEGLTNPRYGNPLGKIDPEKLKDAWKEFE